MPLPWVGRWVGPSTSEPPARAPADAGTLALYFVGRPRHSPRGSAAFPFRDQPHHTRSCHFDFQVSTTSNIQPQEAAHHFALAARLWGPISSATSKTKSDCRRRASAGVQCDFPSRDSHSTQYTGGEAARRGGKAYTRCSAVTLQPRDWQTGQA